MLPRTAWLLVAVTLATLASPIEAGHCSNWWTSSAEIDTTAFIEEVASERVYIDLICNDPQCNASGHTPAIYAEANGINGLQRSDNSVGGTCHGRIDPDQRILA